MQTNRRVDWIDFIKGIAAMLVILTHTPGTPRLYQAIISFIMLPSFFIASGYVNKISEPRKPWQFLYKRVLKLYILYAVYCFLLPFSGITELKKLLNEGGWLLKLKSAGILLVTGRGFWFVACLISVSVIFAVLICLSNNNRAPLFAMSLALCAAGIVISRIDRNMIPWWYFDRALVCQFFYVCGYLMKEYGLPKEKMCGWNYVILSGAVYAAILTLSYLFLDEGIAINVARNMWGNLFVTVFALLGGNIFAILLSAKVGRVKFINYIGQHSLLYFAFASHAMSVMNKVFALLFKMTRIPIFDNGYIVSLLICVTASALMIIPCLVIDRFLPFLNGKFKLPDIKKAV